MCNDLPLILYFFVDMVLVRISRSIQAVGLPLHHVVSFFEVIGAAAGGYGLIRVDVRQRLLDEVFREVVLHAKGVEDSMKPCMLSF